MKKAKFLAILNLFLFLSIILWIFGWLFVGAYYCNPNAEDLSLSQTSRDLGIIRGIANTMISYDGRYFTNLLHGVNPLSFNWLAGYKWMPVFGICFFALSLNFFLTGIFERLSQIKFAFLSVFFTAIHFALSPSLPHDLYWMVSSFVYLYPWSFTFLWVGCYLRFKGESHQRYAFLWLWATSFLLICCIGMNEMFLISNSILLLAIGYTCFKQGKQHFLITLPLLVIGLACILFFISSPGIATRMASDGFSKSNVPITQKFIQSIFDYSKTTVDLMKNGILFSSSLLVILHAESFRIKSRVMSTPKIGYITALFLFLSYLMTLAFYIPMEINNAYPSRIFNSSVVVQELLAFIILPLALMSNSRLIIIKKQQNYLQPISTIILFMLLFLLITTNNNISKIRKEFIEGTIENYECDMQARYTAIAKVKSSQAQACWKVVVVDSLRNPPTTIFSAPDICHNRNPAIWNQNYEIYFGVDEIRLKGDTAIKP